MRALLCAFTLILPLGPLVAQPATTLRAAPAVRLNPVSSWPSIDSEYRAYPIKGRKPVVRAYAKPPLVLYKKPAFERWLSGLKPYKKGGGRVRYWRLPDKRLFIWVQHKASSPGSVYGVHGNTVERSGVASLAGRLFMTQVSVVRNELKYRKGRLYEVISWRPLASGFSQRPIYGIDRFHYWPGRSYVPRINYRYRTRHLLRKGRWFVRTTYNRRGKYLKVTRRP